MGGTGTGAALSAAQSLSLNLQHAALVKLCTYLGCRSELDRLAISVSNVIALLSDLEGREEILSLQARNWIGKLKDAIYDSDDMLDYYLTLAQQKKKMLRLLVVGEIHWVVDEIDRVSTFFNFINKNSRDSDRELGSGVRLAVGRRIKEMRLTLDGLFSDLNKLGFKVDSESMRRMLRHETTSFVIGKHVIGREADVEAILGILVDTRKESRPSIVTIVGMGGLGKTSVAQLVFNDRMVEREFDCRMWICLSDEYTGKLDRRRILERILESATNEKPDKNAVEQLQRQVLRVLRSKSYFLVLDDLWIEDRSDWVMLEELLTVRDWGRRSCVLVTTRFKKTARVIGNSNVYELQALSEEASWRLFEMMAFEQKQDNPPDLVLIGKEILKRCANVPLAIRVVASLLYGQDKKTWLTLQSKSLAELRDIRHVILLSLRLNPPHVYSLLKSCLCYCALFPKGFVIKKQLLISLWLAQGCIVPVHDDERAEDVAGEYFLILLESCFFQDVQQDENGEIVSCVLNDLVYDVAQEVGGEEICVVSSISKNLDPKTRHLFLAKTENTETTFSKINNRTFLQAGWNHCSLSLDSLLAKWMYLRVMDLSYSNIESLPNAIGKLLHLRYLDLSENHVLEKLPRSITKLLNLQSLKLSWCLRLRKLPKDLFKLVNLRILDIAECKGLTYMPSGMNKLTNLQSLRMFVVASKMSSLKQRVGKLEDLKDLRYVKDLSIRIPKNAVAVDDWVKADRCLLNKEDLNNICFMWEDEGNGEEDYVETLLEYLQPHPNLKALKLYGYAGVKFPNWERENSLGTFLPNVVKIHIKSCSGLQSLPSLGKLHFLRSLILEDLPKLEYVENIEINSGYFFPSLEVLCLRYLRNLKAWWKEFKDGDDQLVGSGLLSPSFVRLSELTIDDCPRLTYIPFCPNIENLSLRRFNETSGTKKKGLETSSFFYQSSADSSLGDSLLQNLKSMDIDDVKYLKSLTWSFQHLTKLEICFDNQMENLSEVEEALSSCSSSLRSLRIDGCSKLTSLSGGFDHLSVLDSLIIQACDSLDFADGKPWKSLCQGLRSLELDAYSLSSELPSWMQHLTALHSLYLSNVDKLEVIPEWIGHLLSLRFLRIGRCKKLRSLPEAISNLSSLLQFEILSCSNVLMKRCQGPSGEDWHIIQHIPHFVITPAVWES